MGQAVPGLDLLFQVVLHPHPQLVQLVPLLCQPHSAVFCVFVVQDKCLFHGCSKVLNLLQLAPHSSDLLVLALWEGSKEERNRGAPKKKKNYLKKLEQRLAGEEGLYSSFSAGTFMYIYWDLWSKIQSSVHLHAHYWKPGLANQFWRLKNLLLGNVLKILYVLCPTPPPLGKRKKKRKTTSVLFNGLWCK